MPITATTTDSSKLTRAILEFHQPGASLGKEGALISKVEFQFNPKELTMAKSAKWDIKSQNKSKTAPPATYLGPDPQKMTLEMFFDATSKHDDSVVKRVETLFGACTPTAASRESGVPGAPWVVFNWGALHGFVGYIKSVSAKYTLFSSDGVPLRAVCTVQLEELATEPKKQNPTSGGLQARRVHTLREGDTLPRIAFTEYGNAALWRAVADVNGIDDPIRLRPGDSVYLPTATEFSDPGTLDTARREVSRVVH